MAAEVLAVGDADAPRRRRRWPWALAVLALAAAVAVPPGRAALQRRSDEAALGRIAQAWAERAGAATSLAAAVTALEQRSTLPERPAVGEAQLALERELEVRLRRLAADVAAAGGADRPDGVRAARDSVHRSLLADADTLAGLVAARAPGSAFGALGGVAADRADSLLAAAARRLGEQLPSVRPVALHAADALLARLSRLVDSPVPVRLLVVDATGPSTVLDLARNRESPGVDLPGTVTPVSRRGWVAVSGVAVPLDGGVPVPFATGDESFFAAKDPDLVWATDPSGSLRRVNSRGRQVGVRLRPPGFPQAEVTTGLVLVNERVDGSTAFQIWDPASRRTVRRLAPRTSCLAALAGGVDVVAYYDCASTSLHLVDARTGTDRLVPGVLLPLGGTALVSPDGRQVAVLPTADFAERQRLQVVDTATLQVVSVQLSSTSVGSLLWTPDSRRVFFAVDTVSGARGVTLWTYALGAPAAVPVRHVGTGTSVPVAVLP